MPRKPTIYVKIAREGILEMVPQLLENQPLPTLRELGEDFSLHPSTILRLLRDLETEGSVWQGPSGRFFAATARSEALRGAPLCFIGRQMLQWNKLYQEMLEGVAEVCSANGSPLIIYSALTLVRVPVELQTPVFATLEEQIEELARIVPTIPRGCAGSLLDHLWMDEALSSASFLPTREVQLLSGSGKHAKTVAPDYAAGVEMLVNHVRVKAFGRVCLVVPFHGDPAIQQCFALLRAALSSFDLLEIPFDDVPALQDFVSRTRTNRCLVCLEDNTALDLANKVLEWVPASRQGQVEVLATQGTGVVKSPHTRLRYDYRRLGRTAASNILHGTPIKHMRPSLITSADGDEV